ncbi:hypothetical protein [Saccharopolyspora karakumensis]|uniref:hypothetical protein n=1 Tax=Saccharopolyspora karakumensis TaxID=2530386 RepID=UPI001A9F4CDD|nr:hypothetical protein [Saccharopolyspora karakumensis]
MSIKNSLVERHAERFVAEALGDARVVHVKGLMASSMLRSRTVLNSIIHPHCDDGTTWSEPRSVVPRGGSAQSAQA